MAKRIVSVGDRVRVALLLGRGKEWLGIGDVKVDGVALRDGSRPMVVRVDTPEGILYTRYFLEEVKDKKSGAVDVRFRAVGRDWGRQEYCDEYGQPMISVELRDGPIEDTLILQLKPVRQSLGGREWTGFSYSLAFKSRRRSVHRIVVHGSWELGGTISGNTVLSQGQCNMAVYRGTKKSLFTTTCLKTLDQYGSPQGVSYQLGPRGGLVQAFDFQHGAQGALLQYWPRFDAISSVLESPAGSARLNVIDEYRFPLARSAATTPQRVLFTPGAPAPYEGRDLWWEAYQHVNGGIRKAFGVAETPVRPECVGVPYRTRLHEGRLKYGVGEFEVDSTKMFDLLADKLLPRMAEQGVKRYMDVVHYSDATELGMRRKLEGGIHGDLVCSSVCGSHRFLPADFWGGMKGWRKVADRARALDMEIGCWFAPHFSPRAPIFRDHPDWFMAAPDTLHWSASYNDAIATVDWSTGVYDWVLADLQRWAEEGGLDYMFIDSWANMGLVGSNYAAGMRTNFQALGRLLADVQKLGVKAYTFEGISPFGASRFGAADLRGDLLGGVSGVVGQNDFAWWADEPDMAFGLCIGTDMRRRPEEEERRVHFRFMANRGAMMQPLEMSEWQARLNFTYEQALAHMKVRRLLPDGAGVRWLDGDTEVIWAYEDVELPVGAKAGVELLDGRDALPVEHGGTLAAKAGAVYRVSR